MHKQSIYLERWYANEYDDDRFGGVFGRHLHDQEVETFLSMVDGSLGTILDVGAGTGKLSLPLIRRSRQVTSADFSAEMLGIARRKADRQNVALKPITCDAHHLCFQDKTFGCVVSSRMLMHLADWKQGLSELCRVAQDVVVIDFPPLLSFSGLDSLFKRCKSFFVSDVKTYKAFLTSSIVRELQTHHFRVVMLKREFFLPVAFHRWLNRPQLSLRIEKLCRLLGLAWLLGAPVTIKAIREPDRCPSVTER
jgi:ubiquinone/menaquinone biosynthesis C-methylase UbiE